jgi:hypothetical protein
MSSSCIIVLHSSLDTLRKVAEELVGFKTVCVFDKDQVEWCTLNNPLQKGYKLLVYRAPQKIQGAYLSKSMVLKTVTEVTGDKTEQFAVL